MKAILIIVLGVGLSVYGLYYYLTRYTDTLKPILPTVFFEPAENSQVIAIDFNACPPSRGTVSGDFGSVKVELYSQGTETCLINYGSPAKEGKPWTRCLVPRSLDKKLFNKTYEGVDFSEISKYCKQI